MNLTKIEMFVGHRHFDQFNEIISLPLDNVSPEKKAINEPSK